MNKGVFPDELKHADVKPIYKKESRNEKENYRPVRILPNLSKIFERCMYDQLNDYFHKPLSKYQCRFRKGFSTQHCLLAIIEKLRKSLDSGGKGGWVSKLHTYGIKKGSLNLLFSYLKIESKEFV